MSILVAVLAVLSAALHCYIWLLESFWWTTRAREVFGTTLAEAEATKELAFNQGFYNLFLAIITLVGTVLLIADQRAVGAALVLAGTGAMLAAALTLAASDRTRLRAAITQGSLPLLTVLATTAVLFS